MPERTRDDFGGPIAPAAKPPAPEPSTEDIESLSHPVSLNKSGDGLAAWIGDAWVDIEHELSDAEQRVLAYLQRFEPGTHVVANDTHGDPFAGTSHVDDKPATLAVADDGSVHVLDDVDDTVWWPFEREPSAAETTLIDALHAALAETGKGLGFRVIEGHLHEWIVGTGWVAVTRELSTAERVVADLVLDVEEAK